MPSKQENQFYIGNQIKQILNTTDKDCLITLQIKQGDSKTNHLNITENQLLAIELILVRGK